MQGAQPVEIAVNTSRRPVRRIYIVAALVAVVLLVAYVAAVFLRGPDNVGPQPSPGIVELASSYERLQTLAGQDTFPAWAPDGEGMATYSDQQVHLWDLKGEVLSNRGSLPVNDVQGMLWSPDASTLAVYSMSDPEVLYPRAPIAIPESSWPLNMGYLTPTLTLIDAGTASVRSSTLVSLPVELPPDVRETLGWRFMESDFRLLGWTDGGLNLVSICNLHATNDWSGGPIHFVRILAYQVWDAQTGRLVKSQVMMGSSVNSGYLTTLYDIALSPDGRTIAFAVRDENPRLGMPFDPGLALELWDVATGQLKHSVPGLKAEYGLDPRKPWRKMEWSPDSATLYVATKSSVKVIDASTGSIVRQLPDVVPPTSTPTLIPTWIPTSVPQAPLMPIPVSTGAPIVAAPTPNVPVLPVIGDFLRSFLPKPQPAPAPTIVPDPNYYAPIVGIALSPAGNVLAVHDLHVIRLWDTAAGQLKTFTGVPEQVPIYTWTPSQQGGPPPVIAWSPDGRLLSSLVTMGGARVWLVDPDTGKPLKPVGKPASAFEWSPYTGLLAIVPQAGIQGGVIEIWRAKEATRQAP